MTTLEMEKLAENYWKENGIYSGTFLLNPIDLMVGFAKEMESVKKYNEIMSSLEKEVNVVVPTGKIIEIDKDGNKNEIAPIVFNGQPADEPYIVTISAKPESYDGDRVPETFLADEYGQWDPNSGKEYWE